MKPKYSSRLLSLSFCGLLGLLSCSSNLADTLVFVDVPVNAVSSIINHPGATVDIEYYSFIREQKDLLGVLLYLSDNQNDIDNLNSRDINTYFPDITQKPGYKKLQSPDYLNFNQENRQLTRFINVTLPQTSAAYFSSTVLFQSSIWGAIHKNEGYFETKKSETYVIFPLSVLPYSMDGGTDNSLTYDGGTNTVVLGTGGTLVLSLVDTGVTNPTSPPNTFIVPHFETSTAGNGVLDASYIDPIDPSNPGQPNPKITTYTRLAPLVYGQGVTVLVNHLYYVKDGNNYFKVYVKDVNSSLQTTTDPLTLKVDVYFSAVTGADQF